MAKCLRHWTWNQENAGSNPGLGSNFLSPHLGLRKVGSESSPSDEKKKKTVPCATGVRAHVKEPMAVEKTLCGNFTHIKD